MTVLPHYNRCGCVCVKRWENSQQTVTRIDLARNTLFVFNNAGRFRILKGQVAAPDGARYVLIPFEVMKKDYIVLYHN